MRGRLGGRLDALLSGVHGFWFLFRFPTLASPRLGCSIVYSITTWPWANVGLRVIFGRGWADFRESLREEEKGKGVEREGGRYTKTRERVQHGWLASRRPKTYQVPSMSQACVREGVCGSLLANLCYSW